MKGLASLKEFASSVGRTKGSGTPAPGRDVRIKGSPAEYVDEQIALLVKTIEAETRTRHMRERDAAVKEPPPAPTDSPGRARVIGVSGPTVAARLLDRCRRWWPMVRRDVAFIVLAAAVGIVVGAIFGR
jgi:hypothetical protein